MKSFVAAAVFLLVTSQAMSAQICQPPQSETVFFRTKNLENIYVASDFEQGKVLHVFQSDNGHGSNWLILDLNIKRTFVASPDGGCFYWASSPDDQRLGYDLFAQCLPDSATQLRSGDTDFYYMESPGLEWLVGMKPVPGTEYFFTHFSRFSSKGIDGEAAVPTEDTFGVAYKYNVGLTDPTVFDKDLASCVEGPYGP
ncbi:hypothetical protein ElyMa_006084100 [Elysia marginata]|uniref:DOMON domain-containing protein n=1 Tax=Elysia marginata TaxID=1093978 RepID=A0AAV4GR61_9GAST|nr:hypothetical protein ElyMa_006084100 [Elysia marginata]